MKTVNFPYVLHSLKGRLALLSMGIMIMLLVSCQNDDATPDFSAEDTESAGLDAMDDYYFDDADDLATEALATDDQSGGRISSDERLACAVISHTGTKQEGILTVDFGDGCTDPRGNVRKGSIVVTHDGPWNSPGASWSITFLAYSINGITLEGTRTVQVVSVTDSLIVCDVTLVGGKITWPDGRFATREVNRRREHERNENHLLDRLIIYGKAQGALRNGRGYVIEILERLVYDRSCAAEGVIIPVKGVKFIKHGNRELTVDYGDGTCDNFVTLTNKNGRSVRYEVGK
jgi:hypothetical protein